MKIAFATSDCRVIDEQFRRATYLVVYEITPDGQSLDRICAFPQDCTVRTEERIRAIAGASIVYVTAIGPSSAARLAARGIRPAPLAPGTPITRVLAAYGAPELTPFCQA
jgi:nitrogen fixation protein NifX